MDKEKEDEELPEDEWKKKEQEKKTTKNSKIRALEASRRLWGNRGGAKK